MEENRRATFDGVWGEDRKLCWLVDSEPIAFVLSKVELLVT